MSANTAKPLLIELFTEELPPKALKKLGEAFGKVLFDSLSNDEFLTEESQLVTFATPRRLAARVTAVRSESLPKNISTKLMPVAIGLDASGKATPALAKKIRKDFNDAVDVDAIVAQCKRVHDGKSEQLVFGRLAAGLPLSMKIKNSLDLIIDSLPIPKVMRYQLADGVTDVEFVRPAHGLVVLHGDDEIAATALGLTSGNFTHGHRFQGANNIEIDTASRYEELLRQYGKVEPVFAKRRDMILSQLEAKAKALNATLGSAESYADLLDEVNSLVEWPTIYVCQFEEQFLAVPQECLILTMKTNQKYFPLFDTSGKLKNQFLIVSNMELTDPSKVIQGNERVVRPRLADARFFFETDKKTKLESRVPELAKVVYHNKLGTQGERVKRLSKLAGEIATRIGADRAKAEHAALLAKADLPTLMVGEFPELQGIMGRYYATADGEAADVAAACEQHYMPRFAGDRLPDAGVPTAVALADKLETLAGLFGIGQTPTGDKDPFALRRHALGIFRICEAQSIDLSKLIASSQAAFPDITSETIVAISDFIWQRIKQTLVPLSDGFDLIDQHEATGARVVAGVPQKFFTTNQIESVVSLRPHDVGSIRKRLDAVVEFLGLPEATSLNAANKRVANILKKAVESNEAINTSNAPQEPAEVALRSALNAVTPTATALFAKGDFTGYLKSFAALKTPVDEFFDKVMVMAEDKAVRANRLALLRDLRDAMNKVADLSKLAT
jgi:glycyl-tRNA synthetase beta chain